jgi:hypothetical protein
MIFKGFNETYFIRCFSSLITNSSFYFMPILSKYSSFYLAICLYLSSYSLIIISVSSSWLLAYERSVLKSSSGPNAIASNSDFLGETLEQLFFIPLIFCSYLSNSSLYLTSNSDSGSKIVLFTFIASNCGVSLC